MARASGTYSSECKSILVENGKKAGNVLFHELLHATSDNDHAVGFRNKDTNLGRGINEYVTEYINIRVFNSSKKGYFDKLDYDIIDSIVQVVGLEKLIYCYFNSDLANLMNSFLGYQPQIIIDFISELDKYYYFMKNRKKINPELLESYKQVFKIKILEFLEKGKNIKKK